MNQDSDLPVTASATSPAECAEVLKVLADATRLAVLRLLMSGPKHVGKLNQELQIEQSLLSHHLRVLRDHNLVVAERDGKAVLYRLAPGTLVSTGSRAIDLGCCHLTFDEQPKEPQER